MWVEDKSESDIQAQILVSVWESSESETSLAFWLKSVIWTAEKESESSKELMSRKSEADIPKDYSVDNSLCMVLLWAWRHVRASKEVEMRYRTEKAADLSVVSTSYMELALVWGYSKV